jgi:DNA repair protein RadD
MNAQDVSLVERVLLQRVSVREWENFLNSTEGEAFGQSLQLVRATLREAGLMPPGAPPRPVGELIDVYGNRLLTHPDVGPWLRRILLENMPSSNWERLRTLYPLYAGKDAEKLHGAMTQKGSGSRVMAGYWRVGGRWSAQFCEKAGLPQCLSERDEHDLPIDMEIWPAEPRPELHDYQCEVYEKLRALLQERTGTAMLSLPTGAGKTRVAVEAVCDHLACNDDYERNIVLWLAQSEELQNQAWECFQQVWQVPPDRTDGQRIKRIGPLRLLCAWGGRSIDSLELDSEKTVIVAGIQQLHSWVQRHPERLQELFPRHRRAAIIVDEAHRVIADQHRDVLVALDLRLKNRWQHPRNAAPVIGLTATPWRTEESSDVSLRSYFQTSLLRPDALGKKPIHELQERKILSKVKHQTLNIKDTPAMSEKQRRDFETFHERDLPPEYLKVLGRDVKRNVSIIHKLVGLGKNSKVLVFACSIEHAELLTLLLNRALGPCAAVVTGKTPRGQRAAIIERFRNENLKFLCNVGVLTTGFDAPKANVVCLTRPTCSALLYEQMVGRGLRGPKNGGTEECLVIDVQDAALPTDVQSYARVVKLWDSGLMP